MNEWIKGEEEGANIPTEFPRGEGKRKMLVATQCAAINNNDEHGCRTIKTVSGRDIENG